MAENWSHSKGRYSTLRHPEEYQSALKDNEMIKYDT